MASVTINNLAVQSIVFQVGTISTSTQNLLIGASLLQDYKYRINGGSYTTIIASDNYVNIPFASSFSYEVLTLEIVCINGGLLSNITSITNNTSCFVRTSTADLLKFTSLTSIALYNPKSNISGNISDLSATLTSLAIPNSLDGAISDFENTVETLEFLNCDNNKTKSAAFTDLPSSLQYLSSTVTLGVLTFTGTSATFPSTLRSIWGIFGGVFTIDTATLPANMQYIDFENYATPNLTITGDIADIPSSVYYFTAGTVLSEDLSGDIDDLPNNMNRFVFRGASSNTITGNISNLPTEMQYFVVKGNNTITGDIDNIPSTTLYEFVVYGNNTISGLIQNWATPIYLVDIQGDNTISGNLGLCTKITSLTIYGDNTISDFTYPSSNGFSNNQNFKLDIIGDSALSSTEVDNILIELASTLTISGAKTIRLTGTGTGARTAASDSAHSYLVSKGYNVYLN